MKKYFLKDLGKQEIKSLISRETIQFDKTLDIVRQIEQDVINKGDQCLKELTEKFDGINLDKIRIDKNEIQNSSKLVEQELKDAIKKAFVCIKKFHENQLQKEPKVETEEGVNCWREARAISDVGFYIPSGTAPLFSTVLMLGVPALIAGSRRIVVCTPPPVAPEILYACKILDIDEVYQVGGAQAIFAMTYGTDEISKVDKIFGPGNRFVSCAKALASSKVAIDMIAGPSEVLVIADNDSNPSFVASDLLSQAEHGADSQSVLVCLNEDKADQIIKEAYKQLEA
ncbi:MAG: histidinol dehydrogenase, partial [Candidatus Gracilibacteria bacterium]|nr:histidinol dehydrogenase [Candidatus Gracilibacteria bacterium]